MTVGCGGRMDLAKRHKGCPFFEQSPNMWFEGEYICENTKDKEVLSLLEVPTNCIKGLKPYKLPAGKIYYEQPTKSKTKIYKFKPKEQQ